MRHRLRNGLRGFLLLESQVFDDRGRWRPTPRWSEGALGSLDEQTQEALRRAFRARCTPLGKRWTERRGWFRLVAGVIAALLILAIVPGRAVQLVLLAIVGVGVLTDIRYARCLTWTDLMILRDVLLAHRVCAHCGYSLADAAEEADGCVVCPECGGAWRLDQVAKTSATGFPPNS
jgi:ribosomal protein L32